MPSSKRLFVVIIGCGRLGSYVANRMSHAGHSVVVVDVNDDSFETLAPEFSGFRIEGDATEFRVLKEAKADRADLFLAVTHDDNINLMVAQVAKRVLHVPNVMVRVSESRREEVYRELGIDTICPSVVTGDAISAIAGALAFD